MMRSVFLLFLLLPFAFPVSGPAAEDPALAVIITRLEARATQVDSLSCRFEQTLVSAMFEDEQQSSGRLLFERPERLRWEMLRPYEQGFAVDGEGAVRWRGAVPAQAFRLADSPGMQGMAEQLLAWLRGDYEWLARHYRIEVEGDQPVRLRLTPHDADDGPLRYLRIEFAPGEAHLSWLEMVQWDGDVIRLAFSQVELNRPLDAALFRQR